MVANMVNDAGSHVGVKARCPRVTDYDDSIGGEGEITCGKPMDHYDDLLVCRDGHRWMPCACEGPTCWGWKVARG